MSKLIGLAFGAIALLSTVAAHAADPQPGLWKISAKSERNGVTVGERSLDSCITADAARSLTQAKLDQQFDPRNECKAVDEQRVGNSLSWRVQCTGPVPAETRGLFVFDTPDHYSVH
jgi:hypothetical protein